MFFFGIILLPSVSEAWGPLTHVYLGSQVLDIGAALIPAGIYSIIKKYKNDFLYGNVSADIIIGRRFQNAGQSSHDWTMAWKLLDSAKTDRLKAFACGYLMHLCSDAVVHNIEPVKVPFSHSLIEIRSDSIIDKRYRTVLKMFDRRMQKKNDIFLEKELESLFFSFKTNRRIFKSVLLLSRFPNYKPVSNFIDNRFPYKINEDDICMFHQESLKRMIDLLTNGQDADILKEHPLGRYQKKAS